MAGQGDGATERPLAADWWQQKNTGGDQMSAGDKAKDKMQTTKGKVKEETGRALDDPALEAEGKGDKVSGNLKQAGEKVKDAFGK
jgi:uncharacterized protein YjbJ (UPF0337 family)